VVFLHKPTDVVKPWSPFIDQQVELILLVRLNLLTSINFRDTSVPEKSRCHRLAIDLGVAVNKHLDLHAAPNDSDDRENGYIDTEY